MAATITLLVVEAVLARQTLVVSDSRARDALQPPHPVYASEQLVLRNWRLGTYNHHQSRMVGIM